MFRISLIAVPLFFLLISNSFAGGFGYPTYNSKGSLVASVEIEDKGFYNLVMSIIILKEPRDEKDYTSDEYEELIENLVVKWRGIALQKTLELNTIKRSELVTLKISIETEIEKYAEELKVKYNVPKKAEIIFSLSDFYLIRPSEH